MGKIKQDADLDTAGNFSLDTKTIADKFLEEGCELCSMKDTCNMLMSIGWPN